MQEDNEAKNSNELNELNEDANLLVETLENLQASNDVEPIQETEIDVDNIEDNEVLIYNYYSERRLINNNKANEAKKCKELPKELIEDKLKLKLLIKNL